MDFTKSSSYEVHTDTGYRYHEENKAIPTAVSGSDLNAINWELMSLVKGMGIAPKAFNKDDPASYTTVFQAIKKMAWDSPTATESPYLKKTDRNFNITTVVNFNDLTASGIYYSNGNTDNVNAPFSGFSGILIVYNPRGVLGTTGGVGQVYIGYTGSIAYRYFYPATNLWTDWKTNSSLSLPVGKDLSTLYAEGFYYQQASANCLLSLNYPIEGTYSAGILEVFRWQDDNTRVVQRYTTYQGRTFMRTNYINGWSVWTESITVANVAYTGATQANVDFPVGTSLLVVDSAYATRPRNAQTAIIYLSTANTYQYTTSTGGSALNGTWACRGGTSTASIFQRVL